MKKNYFQEAHENLHRSLNTSQEPGDCCIGTGLHVTGCVPALQSKYSDKTDLLHRQRHQPQLVQALKYPLQQMTTVILQHISQWKHHCSSDNSSGGKNSIGGLLTQLSTTLWSNKCQNMFCSEQVFLFILITAWWQTLLTYYLTGAHRLWLVTGLT